MQGSLTIGKTVVKESIRGRIFSGLLLFLVLFLLFSVYISSLSMGNTARVIQNTGMLGISLVSLTVTILFGLYSLYREKERNELYVIVSRVSRSAYILGRFLGTACIITLFALLAGAGIFLFTWFFGQTAAPGIFWAVYWAVLEFTLLFSIGMLLYAVNTGFTLNALMMLAVYVVGHSLDESIQSFAAIGKLGSELHLTVVRIISYVFPNLDMFDFRLAIVHGDAVPSGQIILSSIYWLFYLLAVLSASIHFMNGSDL